MCDAGFTRSVSAAKPHHAEVVQLLRSRSVSTDARYAEAMQIEVIIRGWEQGCCGTPFRISDHMTWKLHATYPTDVPEDALPRFDEEHHDQTPAGVPHWDISGVVVAITGINYPPLPITGEPGSFTWDTEHPQNCAIQSVGDSGDPEFEQYRVVLDVAENADLPPYAPGETGKQREADALIEALNHERMHDEIGLSLEALADHAQSRYGNVARITRASDRSAVTAEPHRADATAIHWARSSENDDGIMMSVGDGTWQLSASVADADLVGEFLEAAADGRVEEHVRPGNGKERQLVTEVLATDGRFWTEVTDYEPFDAGNGVFSVIGPLWDRIQRGEHQYQPWER